VSIRIDLHPSRLLLCFQTVQIALAVLACLCLLEWSALSLLVLLPLIPAFWHLFHPQHGPRALVLMTDEWHLVYDQEVCRAELQERVYCAEYLQILQFKVWDEGQHRARHEQVLILPDSTDSAARRRLRALLRWYPFPAAAAVN
jgi:hypothetical protein